MPLTHREQELLRLLNTSLAHAYIDLSPAETWKRIGQGLPALAEFARQISQE
jgi:hypothetical protein